MRGPEEDAARIWIANRASQYLNIEICKELARCGSGFLGLREVDQCVEHAIRDYKDLLAEFIKMKTGQLTEKDVAYYEQTGPAA